MVRRQLVTHRGSWIVWYSITHRSNMHRDRAIERWVSCSHAFQEALHSVMLDFHIFWHSRLSSVRQEGGECIMKGLNDQGIQGERMFEPYMCTHITGTGNLYKEILLSYTESLLNKERFWYWMFFGSVCSQRSRSIHVRVGCCVHDNNL